MGSTSLQVSLVEFSASKSQTNRFERKPIEVVKILSEFVDTRISGIEFDQILTNFMAEEFDKLSIRKGKPSIRDSKSGMLKLLKNCKKLKEVLSANKETLFYVESLHDDVDFKIHVNRADFEERSKDILEFVTPAVDYVLERANKKIKNIDSFEIIGGSVRIPKIQQILTKHLDGS